jgi:uncharacterized coiled-coil protein SlyX
MKRCASMLVMANCLSLAIAGTVQAQQAVASDGARLDQLEAQVGQQAAVIEEMRKALDAQDDRLDSLQRELADERLRAAQGRGAPQGDWLGWPGAGAVAQEAAAPLPTGAAPASDPATSQLAQAGAGGPQDANNPVGQAPEAQSRPPEVAQIFDQPGVLTPRGTFVLEPSLQMGYSANDRVALVGFTIIPAILIGLIDVRQVKTTTGVLALTGRYGLTDRLELEARVPYVYVNGDTISREIFTGSAQDKVFNADGRGIGDAEFTARYQINQGGPDKVFYVGWLRYKSRTGKDLFEVTTDCVTRCAANATGTGLPLELPTGSGFEAIQPGITWLYPSDPVVFFGSLSYLYNFERHDVSRTVLSGAPEGFPQTTTEFIGDVKAGNIIGFNIGMGLALNEKASISIGYDQSIVDKTEQNGEDAPGAVRVILGTLVLGGSYRFSDRYSINVALGVGVTRDTPDMTLTVRVPAAF